MNHNLCKITSFNKVGVNDTNDDFSVNFENHRSLHQIVKIIVKAVDIPNVFYNINSFGYDLDNLGNNTYRWINNAAVLQTVVLPVGQYTISQFITALNLLLPDHSYALNTVTKKIVGTASSTIRFLNRADGNLMATALGIEISSLAPTLTHTALNLPQLEGIESVYILSNTAGQSNLLSPNANTFPLLVHVPLNVPYGFIEHYVSPHEELDSITYPNYSNGISFRKLDIKVVDKYGHRLDLAGHDINIILKIYHNL